MATSEADVLAALDMLDVIEAMLRHHQLGEDFRLDVRNPALVLRYLGELTAALIEEQYEDPLAHTAALRSMIAGFAQVTF